MKKSVKNFMNKPITIGGYLKFCGICIAAALPCYGYAYYKMKQYSKKIDEEFNNDNSELDEINDCINVEVDD